MRTSRRNVSTGIVAALAIVASSAVADLQVDFGQTGAPGSETESGYTAFPVTNNYTSPIFVDFSGTGIDDGTDIRITLTDNATATNARRMVDRGATGWTGGLDALLRDWVGIDKRATTPGSNDTLTMTIENLAAGNYLIRSYHTDIGTGGNQSATMDIFVDGALTVDDFQGRSQVGSPSTTEPNFWELARMHDGSTLTIDYQVTSTAASQAFTVLNGIQIIPTSVFQPNSQQLLRYSFEQGTVIEGPSDTVLDVSGNSNDGSVITGSAGAGTVDGTRGNVYSITGADGISVDADSTDTSYTVVMWYKGTDDNGYFFDQETSRFVLGGGASTSGNVGVFDGDWHSTGITGHNDGQWRHLAWTFNDVNGTDQFTFLLDGGIGGATVQNSQVLTNGILQLDSTGAQVFGARFSRTGNNQSGDYDEIAIWDRAMTPGEINELIVKPQTDGRDREKILTVDIGSVGQPIQFAGLADEFSEFSFTGGTGTTADGQTDTYGSITARIDSVSGTVGYRDRGGVSHTAGDLLNDFVFSGSDLILTLSGLEAGVYDLVLYSHDTGSNPHDDFAVLVDGIDTGVIVEASTGTSPAVIGFGIVSFYTDGTGDVVITLDQLDTSSDANIVFNGFELYNVVPTPAALPAGLAMLGLAAARRRRR